jgi:hypothetical protein
VAVLPPDSAQIEARLDLFQYSKSPGLIGGAYQPKRVKPTMLFGQTSKA